MASFRAYRATALLAATAALGEGRHFLFDYALRFLNVAIMLQLWRQILGPDGESGGYTTAAVLTYTLIGAVFYEQLALRTQIITSFWEGTIGGRLLLPIGMIEVFTAEMVGRWIPHLILFSLPLLAAAPLLGVDPRPSSPLAGMLFAVSLLLSIVVGLALDFLFAGLTVASEQPVWLIEQTRNATTLVMTGALLPLALLPWGIGEVFELLPFAATASTPLRIYTGQGEPPLLLLSQALWAVVLWPVAHRLWTSNREKLVGYGG